MSNKIFLGFCLVSTLVSGSAFADKASEVNKCVETNSDQKQTPDVLKSWCECIFEKMPDSSGGTLDSWAKSHKAEDEACGKQAGWK